MVRNGSKGVVRNGSKGVVRNGGKGNGSKGVVRNGSKGVVSRLFHFDHHNQNQPYAPSGWTDQ
jgi:hypothetical protein